MGVSLVLFYEGKQLRETGLKRTCICRYIYSDTYSGDGGDIMRVIKDIMGVI
jgi:hypothetical protein